MSLILSSAPHIRTANSTQRLMLNVVIALLPCVVAGVYYFGVDAAIVLAVAVASAVLAEFVWQKLTRKGTSLSDFSAVITGLLLGLSITPAAPWWMVAIGSAFAIIVVKQLFGGLGDNFLNPALTARAVLLASWPARMTTHYAVSFFSGDAVTSATPLVTGEGTLMQLFMGDVPGAIGETCKAAILLGLVYLLVTRTISWRIPVITLGAAALTSWLLGMDVLTSLLSGGLLFGAVYMATDYVTSPVKKWAQVIYSVGIGALVMLIRKYGAYPEGVTYAILLMNIATPLLDRFIPKKVYGHVKPKEAKAQ